MKQYIYIFPFILFFSCGEKKSALENEILQLKNQETIKNYWLEIHDTDQAHRGLKSIDSLDNLNFKKMILLIQHHGYPTQEEYGGKVNLTPNIVFTHQTSEYINRRYFPILHQAFLEGKADTSWFLHNVKGLHRGKYGRDLIRTRELKIGDINTILNALEIPLQPKIDYNLTEFDNLFTSFHTDVAKIRSAEIKGKWMNDDGDYFLLTEFEKRLFFLKVYRDNSFSSPQEVKQFPNEQKYEYVHDLGFKDYFIVDKDLNLILHLDKKGLKEIEYVEIETNKEGEKIAIPKVKTQKSSATYFHISF